MGLVINSTAGKGCTIITNEFADRFKGVKKSSISNKAVAKIHTVTINGDDWVRIMYVDNRHDDLLLAMVESIDNVSPVDIEDLHNKLESIFFS